MADPIVDKAAEKELVKHFGTGLQKSVYIDEAYEVESFFPDMDERGRWLFCTAAPLQDITARTPNCPDIHGAVLVDNLRDWQREVGIFLISRSPPRCGMSARPRLALSLKSWPL